MITVDDIENIRDELSDIFPDAVRGSVSKSNWGKGRKTLHLCYFIGCDTVGGYMIKGKGDLLYFIDWDTNAGPEYLFAESEVDEMIKRVKNMFRGKVFNISRTVTF